ncbi:hypothetical protein SDC9_80657 [bioreactor metagenome]|uniref:Uncharacterized protein n=1 Tax=bioreactor metagenome TaxID=1076179 RepID=A0A644YZT9_9ZZZZ
MHVSQEPVGIEIIQVTRFFLDRYIHRDLIGKRAVHKVFGDNLPGKIPEHPLVCQYKYAVVSVNHYFF